MKIFTIVGARPNFIKIDPELKQTLVHTGQHYDYEMSEIFFKGLEIQKPEWNLRIPGDQIGRMIDRLRALLKKERPDIVIVIGDTNSAMAGALAAAYENIKVAHIESGLRSFKMYMPEEVNRVIIDHLSTVRFCPNNESALNLLREGISDGVYVVGDPSFETLGRFLPIPKSKDAGTYMLLTMHRNFTVDAKETVRGILRAIGETGENFIFPIHPRTKKNLQKFKVKIPKNIKAIDPQGYKETLHLIANAKKVVTDSGGVQREAYWFNVPVVIMRDETEWNEIIKNGAGVLVGSDPERIKSAIASFKGSLNVPPEPGTNKKIREIIYKYL